jgi:hypothetical protein
MLSLRSFAPLRMTNRVLTVGAVLNVNVEILRSAPFVAQGRQDENVSPKLTM